MSLSILLWLAVGCTNASSAGVGTSDNPLTLTIHSATSLTEVLPEIGDRFVDAEASGDVTVEIEWVLGGSAGLATSIIEGASSDVFVSANSQVTERVVAANLAEQTTVVAYNEIALVVPPDDPATIASDLSRLASASVARCAPEVPCGALAIRTLEELGLAVVPRSEERNVRSVLAKVELGEVDAGFVYRSDALLSGDNVRVIDLPSTGLLTDYTATLIADRPNQPVSERFIDFLSSEPAQELFAARGFTRR